MVNSRHQPPSIPDKSKILFVGAAVGIFIFLVVTVPLAITVYYYRNTFGGEPSAQPEYWAAFGSFFGGIFSPLISFAVIPILGLTVYLQWKIIQTQQTEFSALQKIQTKQLKHAQSDTEFQRISSYKQTIITVLNQQIELFKYQIKEMRIPLENLKQKRNFQNNLPPDPTEQKRFLDNLDRERKLTDSIEELEELIVSHTNLSVEVAINQFDSMRELQDYFREHCAGNKPEHRK